MPSTTMIEMKAFELPVEKPEMHRLTLAFRNPDQEIAFRAWFLDQHLRQFRIGYYLLCAVLLGFGVVEWIMFGEHAKPLLVIRYLFVLPALLLLAPLVMDDRFRPYLRRRFPEVMLIGGLYLLACFAAMGVIMLDRFTQDAWFFAALVYLLTVIFLYLVVRMRFLYASFIAVLGYFSGIAALVTLAEPTRFAVLAMVFAGGVANVLGMFGSYLIERYERLNYLGMRAVASEQGKVRKLLHNILPASIADRLKDSPSAIADGFDGVTVLFADIVGFTQLSSEMDPARLVDLLNKVFSQFDDITERHGAEKIKTIGDAYMAAVGIPLPRVDHAAVAARLALEMQRELGKFASAHGMPLQARIGMHSGPVVAGVIGQRKFIYDLWGDTVNTASRMESHGEASRVQVSAATYALIKNEFQLEKRGTIEVKGKGEMETWWLAGEKTAAS